MYQTFDIDDQEQPETQKNNNYKFVDKYSTSLKPNFIVNQQNQQVEYDQIIPSNRVTKQFQARQNHTQLNYVSLQNMKKVDLQQSLNQIQQIDKNNEEINQRQAKKENKQNATNMKNIYTPSIKDNILFLYEDDQQLVDNNQSQNIQIPARDIGQIYGLDSDSDNQNQAQKIIIEKSGQYFKTKSKQNLSKQLLECIAKSHVLKMQLKRQNSGLSMLWPQYELSFKNQTGFCYAKRTTARPVATYIFSLSPKDFDQSSQSYIGKLKTNIIGNILYIYGPGLNPKNAEQKHVAPRQMLATVVYQTSFLNQTKPRSFSVYVKHPQKNYFSLKGVKMGQQIGLEQLYLVSEENRENIFIFSNSKPKWNQKIGGFMLNFKGRVREASVKNFILQDMQFQQVMMFGKMAQNQFTIQIQDRFSPLVTFGIALSAFDSKFLCE